MSTDLTLTLDELSKHNTASDCYIAIDSIVYDVTKFLNTHPGGRTILLDHAGKDATEAFFDLHRKEVLVKYGPKLKRVGVIQGGRQYFPLDKDLPIFDQVVPFAEHSSILNWKSPYMNDSHKAFRAAIRKFYREHVAPTAEADALAGTVPSLEIYQKMGRAGILACRIGKHVMKFVPQLGITLLAGLDPKKFDTFHEQVAHEESYFTYSSVCDGLGSGFVIGLAPVVYFGSNAQRLKYVPPVLLGDKRICLAISEPQAGSDVANLTATAKISDDGSHYVLQACKKWITNSTFSDFFVTVARTGGPGAKGLSMFLVERGFGNLTTTPIKTSYGGSAGTGWVFYDDVKVPKENLLGKEGDGFMLTVFNFSHERWYIVCATVNGARIIVKECYQWALQRKVFGKRLIDQPVIRYKLAQMSALVESCQAWLDSITYQMDVMTPTEAGAQLAGPIALLKYQTTRMILTVHDQATQIFGGRAITRTGMGRLVEEFNRSVKYSAILGGSEEIMADLAVRQIVAISESKVKKNPNLALQAKL